MCSELTPRARIPDTRIPQLMQPCVKPLYLELNFHFHSGIEIKTDVPDVYKDNLSSCECSVHPETWHFHIKFVFVFVFVFHSSVALTQMSERMMSPVVYKQLIQVQLIHSGRAFASKRKQRSHRCAPPTTSHQRMKFYWQLTNASVQWQICQFQSQDFCEALLHTWIRKQVSISILSLTTGLNGWGMSNCESRHTDINGIILWKYVHTIINRHMWATLPTVCAHVTSHTVSMNIEGSPDRIWGRRPLWKPSAFACWADDYKLLISFDTSLATASHCLQLLAFFTPLFISNL